MQRIDKNWLHHIVIPKYGELTVDKFSQNKY